MQNGPEVQEKVEGNIMDSVLGDGTKSENKSDPVNALKSCMDFGFFSALTGTLLSGVENISNALDGALGGMDSVHATMENGLNAVMENKFSQNLSMPGMK